MLKAQKVVAVIMTLIVSLCFAPVLSFSDVSVEESEISYNRYFFFGDQEVIKEELKRKPITNTELDIIAVGDIMVHIPQMKASYDPMSGKYNFDNNFKFVSSLIKDNDIAICNLETTLDYPKNGFSGFPNFSAPEEIASAIKAAGFNYVSVINNHTNDRGYGAFLRTIEKLENEGLIVLGGRKSEDEKNYRVDEFDNFKVGITAYSYESKSIDGRKNLNGNVLDEEMEEKVNTFNYETLDEDMAKIESEIIGMREEGAEYIVFYVHWGNEFQREEDLHQTLIAEKLNEMGVDLILGSHPHVQQPVKYMDNEDKDTLIAYSLGNFISNQAYETLDNKYTEDGVMFKVKIDTRSTGENRRRETASYIPTWVNRLEFIDGKRVYYVLPVLSVLNNDSSYELVREDIKTRLKGSLENAQDIINRSSEEILFIKDSNE